MYPSLFGKLYEPVLKGTEDLPWCQTFHLGWHKCLTVMNGCRFQEIVPLIACNVVCVEDEAPIPIWEGLICHTLNNKMQVYKANDPLKSCKEPSTLSHCAECIHHVPEMYDGEDEVSALLHSQHLPNTRVLHPEKAQNHLCSKQNTRGSEDETLLEHAGEDSTSIEWPPDAVREDDKESATFAPSISSTSTMFSSPCRQNRFLRIVSKQMVGIYITIWIRSDLRHHVHDIKVCSVGCGIFNYLGNKVGFFCVWERESWEEGKQWAGGGEGVPGCHCIEEKWSVREWRSWWWDWRTGFECREQSRLVCAFIKPAFVLYAHIWNQALRKEMNFGEMQMLLRFCIGQNSLGWSNNLGLSCPRQSWLMSKLTCFSLQSVLLCCWICFM